MVTHYRWDFIGLSTDDKPTPDTSEKVTDGSTFYCSDNSKLYVWYKDQWYEKEDTGGGGDGGVTTLTSADYNYPVDSPTYINTYLLEPGYYMIEPGTKVMIYGPSQPTEIEQPMTVMVFTRYNNSSSKWVLSADSTDGIIICTGSNGRFSSYVRDDSTASSSGITYRPLSANQGYIINQKFGGMRLVQLTQAEYDELATKDPNTLYIIKAV